MPDTPKLAAISPMAMFCRKPCRTEMTQMAMLIAHRVPDRSYSEGRIRMGTPIAMMTPCFQSMVLASSDVPSTEVP